MTSILTNTGAMTALQTLRSINQNLAQTQNEISTGKSISSAKDNSAIWAISKVMESDVAGFKAIKNSLSLGESSVAVARNATESITGLLTEIKGKIVAAQEENVDRAKIQTDIAQLRDQITSIVNAAQFNGLNLLKGTELVDILSSLDRAADGTVTSSSISVDRQDMTTVVGSYGGGGTSLTANIDADTATAGTQNTVAVANTGNTAVVTFNTAADYDGDAATISIGSNQITYTGTTGQNQNDVATEFAARINALGLSGVTASAAGAALTITSTRAFSSTSVGVSGLTGDAAGTQITALNGTTGLTLTTGDISQRAETLTFDRAATVNEGDSYRVTLTGTGGGNFDYIASAGETMEDVARGLKIALDGAGLAGVTSRVAQATDGSWTLQVDNDTATSRTLTVAGEDGGDASGGLFGLDNIDVRTDAGAEAALGNIETLIQSAIDASASFGSAQSRIETQAEFISKLTDSLTAGIGTMVDADLEEASARLQALQVQQQLGIQSLSIANQAPQTILALFR
jgi:flagellin